VSALPPAAASAELEYVGFWPRVLAALIDTLWVMPIVALLGFIFESASPGLTDQLLRDPARISVADLTADLTPSTSDFIVQFVVPAILVVAFWIRRNATPGKMAIHARIVDARTGAAPTPRQLLIRYLGYFVSTIPFGLGLLWVGIDPRRQGWHDKLAGTVVVRPKVRPSDTVSFPGAGTR
jgi:uncharacterized RDD family membrane protein YckC